VAEECTPGTPRDSGGTLSPSLAEAAEENDTFEWIAVDFIALYINVLFCCFFGPLIVEVGF
jgi:hypothetical protein